MSEGKQVCKARCAKIFAILLLAAAVALGIAGLITHFWIEATLSDGKRIHSGLWEECPKREVVAEPEPTTNITTPRPEPQPESMPEPFDETRCDIFVKDMSKLQPWMIATIVICSIGVGISVFAFFLSLGTCCCSRSRAFHIIVIIFALIAGACLFVAVCMYGAQSNIFKLRDGNRLIIDAFKRGEGFSYVTFGYSYYFVIGATFADVFAAFCLELAKQASTGIVV